MSFQQIEHTCHGDGRAGAEGRGGANSRHLLKLAQDATPAGRYALANAVALFFENDELDSIERHLVIEIMMKLIHRTELDLREALAERLAALENVPAEVVIFLANDVISVARPVLRHSPVLNDVDLAYIISTKDADYWHAIAQRAHLSPLVAGRLIDTADTATATQLVNNASITMPRNIMNRLVKISLGAEEIQAPLLRRPEIDAGLASEIYIRVSQALRREIRSKFTIAPAVVEAALDSLVEELCLEAKGIQAVTPEMAALAKRLWERSEVTPVLLTKTLRRGQFSFFIALFAQQLGLAHEFAAHLLGKQAIKSFAIACRSIGMMKSEFASIYLLTQTLRTGEKTVDQKELAEALKYYDHIKDIDVQRIRKEWARNVEGV